MNSETCRNGSMRCTRATGLNAGNGGTLADSVLPVWAVPAGEVSVVAASSGGDSATLRPESGGVGSAAVSTRSLGFVDDEMTEQAGKPTKQARSAARA